MKNSLLSNIAIFAVGAAVGSAVTWSFLKTKYEQIAQEEINAVKEVYSVPKSEVEDTDEDDEESDYPGQSPTIKEYVKHLEQLQYNLEEKKKEEENDMAEPDTIRVISPDEFGEWDDYELVSLRYYADGVIEDEDGEIVENVESLIGTDALNHFGEYEDDSVFVRNEALKKDIEILRDEDPYYSDDDDEPVEE